MVYRLYVDGELVGTHYEELGARLQRNQWLIAGYEPAQLVIKVENE